MEQCKLDMLTGCLAPGECQHCPCPCTGSVAPASRRAGYLETESRGRKCLSTLSFLQTGSGSCGAVRYACPEASFGGASKKGGWRPTLTVISWLFCSSVAPRTPGWQQGRSRRDALTELALWHLVNCCLAMLCLL